MESFEMDDKTLVAEMKKAIRKRDRDRCMELENMVWRVYGDGLGMWMGSRLSMAENKRFSKIKYRK